MEIFTAAAVGLTIYATNFFNEPHVNPAHLVQGGPVVVQTDGQMISVDDNDAHVTAEVFCTNALVLQWTGGAGTCYEVEWTCNFVNWTNSRAWRVGTNAEIKFLTPATLPQCFYRLRVVNCSYLTNGNYLTNLVESPAAVPSFVQVTVNQKSNPQTHRTKIPPPPPMPKMRGRI